MNTGIALSLSELMAGAKSQEEESLLFGGFRRGFIGSLNLCGQESFTLLAQVILSAAQNKTRVFFASERPVYKIRGVFKNALAAFPKNGKEKWLENIFFFFSGNVKSLGIAPAWANPDVAVLDYVGERPATGREHYDFCDRFCRERNAAILTLGEIDNPWTDFDIRCDFCADIIKDGDSYHVRPKRGIFRESAGERFRLADSGFARVAKSADLDASAGKTG